MELNLKNLLEAEQEVNKKVQDALNHKNNLLRSIKDSAKPDIDAFRAHQQAEYEKKLKELIAKIDSEKDVTAGTQVNMDQINEDYKNNKSRVIDLLVSIVLAVNIEIPKVVKGTF